jgi:hypothetical protein
LASACLPFSNAAGEGLENKLVALGVRRDDPELRARLEEVLERRRPEIRRLLASYAVPTVGSAPSQADDDD